MTSIVSRFRPTDGIYRAAALLAINNLALAGFGFLTFTFVARFAETSTLGKFASIVGLAGLAATTGRMGLDSAFILELHRVKDPSGLIVRGLALASAATSAAALIIPAFLLREGVATHDLVLLWVLAVVAGGNALCDAALQAADRIETIVYRSILVGALRVVVLLTIVLFSRALELTPLLIAQILPAAIGFAWGLVATLRCVPIGGSAAIQTADLLRSSLLNHVATIALALPALALPALLLATVGSALAAHFYVATTIAGLAAMAPQALAQAGFATDARSGRVRTVGATKRNVVLALAAATLVGLASPVVLLFLGRTYLTQALVVTLLLVASVPVLAIQNVHIARLRIARRYGRLTFLSIITAAAVVASVIAGGQSFGALGMGLAWILAYTVCVGIGYLMRIDANGAPP